MNAVLRVLSSTAALWVASTQIVLADIGVIPEPGTIALAGLGIAAAVLIGKKRR